MAQVTITIPIPVDLDQVDVFEILPRLPYTTTAEIIGSGGGETYFSQDFIAPETGLLEFTETDLPEDSSKICVMWSNGVLFEGIDYTIDGNEITILNFDDENQVNFKIQCWK